jgi:hypothetical protein
MYRNLTLHLTNFFTSLRHAEDPAVDYRWALTCARQLEDNCFSRREDLRPDWPSHSSEIEDHWTVSFNLPSAGRLWRRR